MKTKQQKGGSSTSEAKAKAARENGKKGGRPRKKRLNPFPLVFLGYAEDIKIMRLRMLSVRGRLLHQVKNEIVSDDTLRAYGEFNSELDLFARDWLLAKGWKPPE